MHYELGFAVLSIVIVGSYWLYRKRNELIELNDRFEDI